MINNKTDRSKYWEINGILNCPVVGTCLSLNEQKKILKKSRVSIADLSDHQIHHTLVQSGKRENAVSRRVHQALENKYKQQIAELGECDEETFLAHWRKGLRRGEIDSLLWAGATNKHLSAAIVTRIFGDYHMHTHGQGVVIRRQLGQVETLQKKAQRLANDLKQIRSQKQQTAQELQVVKRERAVLQRQVEALQKKNQSLQNRPRRKHLQQENGAMADQIRLLKNKALAQSESLAQLEVENENLTVSLTEQTKINQLLQTEFDCLAQKPDADESACATCPQRDLCPYRVLIVGGLNTLRPYYQTLVENGGGEFKHFDGRNGSSERALRPSVGWADVILCPVDFNSHRSCLNVKRLCKKMQKPYHMVPNSSMSSITRTLADISTNQITQDGGF